MKKFAIIALLGILLAGCEQANPDPGPTADTTQPSAVCNDITLFLNECLSVDIQAGDIDGGSTDNVGVDTMWLDRYSFDCNDTADVQSVTLHVLDAGDNYASCVANVTVIDTTPAPDPSDLLFFETLINLTGESPEAVLFGAPGLLMQDTTSLGEREISFLLNPDNIELNTLLAMIYEFSSDMLNKIMFGSLDQLNDQELIYQLSLLSDEEQWFSSSEHLIYYISGSYERIEYFESASELWQFIVDEDISKYKIKMTRSIWGNGASNLQLGYLGEFTDAGVGIVEPVDAKKVKGDVTVMYDKLKFGVSTWISLLKN